MPSPHDTISAAELLAMQQLFTQNTYSPGFYTQTTASTGEGVVAVTRRKTTKTYNQVVQDIWIPDSLRTSGEIGLEIECEGTDLFNSPIQFWSAHSDGSLRSFNGHQPVEYVLKEPLSRGDLDKAFRYLDGRLKASGSIVHDSPRTSVHVHVNCQKMTLKQVINYLILYLIVEDFLVEWCGHDRVGNLFCLRSKDASYFQHLLVGAIRSSDYNVVTNNEYRYMSCNIASLRKFGSLEFRSMRGTVDFDLISKWVDLLLHIKKESLTFDNPQEIIRYFDTYGVNGILHKILPGDWYNLFKYHPDKDKLVWDNVRDVREIAYAIPVWEKEEVKPVKKKAKSFTAYTPTPLPLSDWAPVEDDWAHSVTWEQDEV